MQQVMQGKDGGWKAKAFLESMKKSSPGFDYRMKLDENDRSPVALMLDNAYNVEIVDLIWQRDVY
jgi:hypothetical protein